MEARFTVVTLTVMSACGPSDGLKRRRHLVHRFVHVNFAFEVGQSVCRVLRIEMRLILFNILLDLTEQRNGTFIITLSICMLWDVLLHCNNCVEYSDFHTVYKTLSIPLLMHISGALSFFSC
jgi:hypothetical protein